MTDATDLWAAVVVSYENEGLVQLTRTRDPDTGTILTAFGEDAAQGVIDLWPLYAQEDYAAANSQHVEVAKRGVIAMLWHRGGSSTEIAKVEWDSVFGDEGLIARVKNTGPRARPLARTNSGVTQRVETIDGRRIRGWSDNDSLPRGILPSPRPASE